MRYPIAFSAFAFSSSVLAQIGAVPGVDIRLFEIGAPTIYGRRGAAYPNGEVGMAIGHSMCNTGTVHLPWVGWVSGSGSVMLDTYPKIAFLIACESNGRMVQVSGESHLKHSRVAFNFSGGPCGTCQSGPAGTFRIGCYDVYGTGFNSNQFNLGPTEEIDPWQGSWNPQGSYFDRGDPAVSGTAASDSIQSLSTTGWDAFKNRILVRESELAVSGATFYGQAQVVAKTEPGTNRANNLASRQLNITWSGSAWSASLGAGTVLQGSVLTRWTGATVNSGRNGLDDGHFVVGVKVTGPVNGRWHYEYAVHNQDNHRGGAAIRIPTCPTAQVLNAGFHDVDGDALNDWTMTQTSSEVAFLASATNPLDWNCIYNVWFDSDAAPIAGSLGIDQARVGPGSLSVSVATLVPGLLGNEYLGAGCGTPTPALYANGLPTSPNPSYALHAQVGPAGFVVFGFASQAANVALGGGCTLFLDDAQLLATHLVQANGSGLAAWPLPIPAALSPAEVACQAFELVNGGPVLGLLAASNGLRLRAAGLGCP